MMALNPVSRLCRSVEASTDFYVNVLGFVLIERPPSFDFEGVWLFNYGGGIHLVHREDIKPPPDVSEQLDPRNNHISFQCEDMNAMEKLLKEKNIKYMKRTVDGQEGSAIDQLFFNDPDGFMIKICNCQNIKLVPQRSLGRIKLPLDRHIPPVELGQ
ncbi:hypothetical protein QJS04_geneDACA016555 [Acorus gramineus]|uniref:VOC domain-containing protein n=1 Tax=Acorus gramineus TaxID=55184 RepID=A0AAV9BM78_ACOGR|nr:hypothetical protein QJS04_geneDACA016555 [Acorus gramineus]